MKIGDSIPKFTLPDHLGNSIASHSILGKPVVVFFYPKNFTPGCIKEVCSFRDHYEEFADLGADVVGISSDREDSHRRFSQYYNLPFKLLSDSNGEVRKQFGVQNVLGILPGRETFVFSSHGILTYRFRSMGASQHIEKALQHLTSQL